MTANDYHGMHQDEANRHRALKRSDDRLAAMTEDRDAWKRRALTAERIERTFTTPVPHRYTPIAVAVHMMEPGGLDDSGFSVRGIV